VPFQILIQDVQQLLDLDRASRGSKNDVSWFGNYKTYEEINDHLNELALENPDLATVSLVGHSLEGRDIRMMRITGPDTPENSRDQRPAFLVNGTQHAREWISPMTTMYLIEQLITQYPVDPRVQAIVDSVDFYIIPVANPDGFAFTWSDYRLWRKSRRINEGSDCVGVDLNRNWAYAWGGDGSSSDPCSDIYHGRDPFSEPEIVAIRDVAIGLADRLRAYWDLHSYGQLILSPWMYTYDSPPDLPTLLDFGATVQSAIFSVHGQDFTNGQGSRILYIAAGTAHDWVYGTLGPLAWGIELRDRGQSGFVLPPEQIIPSGEEMFEAFLQLNERLDQH
jgi:Zinc carboxypeptidase